MIVTCASFAVVCALALVSSSARADSAADTRKSSVVEDLEKKLASMEKEIADLRASIKAQPKVSANYKTLIDKLGEAQYLRFSVERAKDPKRSAGNRYWEGEYEGEAPDSERLEVARKWVQAVPDDPAAYVELADLQAEPAEMRRIAETLTRKWPDRFEGYGLMVETLEGQGKHRQATELVEKFRAAHPGNADANEMLLGLYRRDNQSKARALALQWAERSPNDPRAIIAKVNTLDDELPTEELVKSYRSLTSGGKTPEGLSSICSALFERERFQESAECAQAILSARGPEGDESEGEWCELVLVESWERLGATDRAEALLKTLEPSRAADIRVQIAADASYDGNCDLALAMTDPLSAAPAGTATKMRVAMIRSQCGDDDSTATLIDVLKSPPQDENEYGLGRSEIVRELIEMGHAAEARQVIETLLEEKPSDQDLFRARDIIDEKDSDEQTRLAHLQEWARAAPGDPAAQEALSNMAKESGDLKAAIAAMEKAYKLEKNGKSLVSALIDLYLDAGDAARATELAESLDKKGRPGDTDLYLGRIAKHEGRIDEALAHYERYAKSESDGQKRGSDREYLEIYRDRGDIDTIERLLNADYDEKAAHGSAWASRESFLAQELASLDLHALALKHYQIELGREGATPRLLKDIASEQEELKDWSAAEKTYVQAMKLDERDSNVREDLAKLYVRMKRYKEAIDLLSNLMGGHRGTSSDVETTIAEAYIGAGEYQPAIEILSNALDRNPKDYDAAYEIGRAYELSGQSASAGMYYDLFFTLTVPYEAKYGKNCECYCDLIQRRRELAARLSAGTPPSSAGIVDW